MSKLALKDHIVDILKFVASDLESPQTAADSSQVSKTKVVLQRVGPGSRERAGKRLMIIASASEIRDSEGGVLFTALFVIKAD
jgi:hypothetical protein